MRNLRRKLQAARRVARRQLRLWRERRLLGHKRAWRRAADDRAHYERLIQNKIDTYLQPGIPGWGGGKLIMQTEVYPIMKRRGISPTSGKRRETFGNPGSDHFFLNLLAFAKDWATDSNFAAATEIKRALTGVPDATHIDYGDFYIQRYGHTFRVQIIAGTHGTGPHLHIGIRRVS